MDINTKEITIHIAKQAYTFDIGADVNNETIDGLKQFLDIDKEISVPQLLSAYLKKNAEHIKLKKDIGNTVQTLNDFKNSNIT
ncbi:MAG: hypothetical protein DRG78_12985 [Epsilonproteobacteria bacterium]|nr:MAG: hypothetical protein DRG78_12985 [Campylobacterota bacterium]